MAYLVGFVAVDQQLHALAHEQIRLTLYSGLQTEQAVFACDLAPIHEFVDGRLQGTLRRHEDHAEHAHGTQKYLQRGLQQYGADGAAKDDDHRRAVGQGIQVPTLQPVAAEDGSERDGNTDDTEQIHASKRIPIL